VVCPLWIDRRPRRHPARVGAGSRSPACWASIVTVLTPSFGDG
jgi:hypothetical protein